jgi:hypothetical protein
VVTSNLETQECVPGGAAIIVATATQNVVLAFSAVHFAPANVVGNQIFNEVGASSPASSFLFILFEAFEKNTINTYITDVFCKCLYTSIYYNISI